jgi:hypothetical protein
MKSALKYKSFLFSTNGAATLHVLRLFWCANKIDYEMS